MKQQPLFVSTAMEQAYRRLRHFCSRNRMKVVHEFDEQCERTRITVLPKTDLVPTCAVISGHPESEGDLEDYFKQAKIFASA